MEKLDMKSMDITQDNITKIKALFPSAVTEIMGDDGKVKLAIDFDCLKQELSDDLISERAERYQMTWPDKSKAKVLASSRITATLRPDVEKSVDFDTTENLYIEGDNEEACGQISGFMGNFGVLLRAYTYILMLGKQNVRMAGPLAVLGANYIKESLKDCYNLPIDSVCKHEFVFDGLADQSTGVTTLDIAKRLLDYGFHAPTIYFPLLFHQSIMIEPTETESKETLDGFIEIMKHIAAEALSDPDSLKTAPHTTPVRRLDETTAARQPVLKFSDLS